MTLGNQGLECGILFIFHTTNHSGGHSMDHCADEEGKARSVTYTYCVLGTQMDPLLSVSSQVSEYQAVLYETNTPFQPWFQRLNKEPVRGQEEFRHKPLVLTPGSHS